MEPEQFSAIQNSAGFTLIELSIVLLVIGLLAGGVLVGRDLIAAAAVRAQITQIGSFDNAVSAFRGKYDYLPADIPNPTNFGFGADTAGTYCNQNNVLGDGLIDDVNKNYPALWTNCEPGTFFIHLSQANLLKDINGIIFNSSIECGNAVIGYTNYIGCQFPAAKIGIGGFTATSLSNGTLAYFLGMTATFANATFNNYSIAGSSSNGLGVITPAAALALDVKLDDGLPLTGKIQASQYPAVAETRSNYCLTSVAGNSYNISNPAIACNLLIQSSGR